MDIEEAISREIREALPRAKAQLGCACGIIVPKHSDQYTGDLRHDERY